VRANERQVAGVVGRQEVREAKLSEELETKAVRLVLNSRDGSGERRSAWSVRAAVPAPGTRHACEGDLGSTAPALRAVEREVAIVRA
jgi:hypothetical protein